MRWLILLVWVVWANPLLADGKRPNVLFIIADDLNTDLGCYGAMHVRTPHLDRLAKMALRFDRAYVQYTVCNPSRTSFLTGLRPTTTRIMDNNTHFRKTVPNVITLPQLFREQGYESIGLGKVFHRGLSPDDVQGDRDDVPSFDRVFYGKSTALGNQGRGRNLTDGQLPWCRWLAADGADNDQADGQLADEAVKILSAPRDKPLFLAVGFYRPHDPFQSPKRYFDLYDPMKLPIPRSPDGYQLPSALALGGGTFQTAFDRFTDVERREFLYAYYAGISFVDAQVGRLLDALEKQKLLDETIIVFIGDHGYELGVRNWWNKNTLFERSCRTPLLVRVPGARGNGQATSAIVEFIDLYPTLMESCALKAPSQSLEGQSFRPWLDDPARASDRAALTVIKRGAVMGRSLRTARYRYTEWANGDRGRELYDHDADPGEWRNLAALPEQAARIAELSRQIQRLERREP